MFERSEFGTRAPSTEKRGGPTRHSRAGSRPAKTVLVPFAKTKGTRAKRETSAPLADEVTQLVTKSEPDPVLAISPFDQRASFIKLLAVESWAKLLIHAESVANIVLLIPDGVRDIQAEPKFCEPSIHCAKNDWSKRT